MDLQYADPKEVLRVRQGKCLATRKLMFLGFVPQN